MAWPVFSRNRAKSDAGSGALPQVKTRAFARETASSGCALTCSSRRTYIVGTPMKIVAPSRAKASTTREAAKRDSRSIVEPCKSVPTTPRQSPCT
jgi:hypothetical protein